MLVHQLFLLNVALQIFDGVATYFGLTTRWNEGNPLLGAAMAQLGVDELFSTAFQGHRLPPRLGDCWLAVQRGIATGKIDWLNYRMLDAVDGDPRTPQATQRREHLEMFVLLGDPALRLPDVDGGLTLYVTEAVTPGKALTARGRLPEHLFGAEVRVRGGGDVADGRAVRALVREEQLRRVEEPLLGIHSNVCLIHTNV